MTNWTPPPLVTYTADMVLFAEMEETTACVLLIKRGDDPFAGKWALPGGYVETGKGEGSEDAALRETEEETSIDLGATHRGDEILLVGVYDKPGRDPRGLVVSAAYTATLPWRVEPKAGDDAKDVQWVPLSTIDLRQLAFDHGRIVREALSLNGVTLADFR